MSKARFAQLSKTNYINPDHIVEVEIVEENPVEIILALINGTKVTLPGTAALEFLQYYQIRPDIFTEK